MNTHCYGLKSLISHTEHITWVYTHESIHIPLLSTQILHNKCKGKVMKSKYYDINEKYVETVYSSLFQQVDSGIGLSGDETSLVDAETSSSSGSSSTTVSTQSSGKTRKPPKVLQISPPTLLVTTSDFSPMSLCSPSLPTASLTPAMLQVSVWIHPHLEVKSVSFSSKGHIFTNKQYKSDGTNKLQLVNKWMARCWLGCK